LACFLLSGHSFAQNKEGKYFFLQNETNSSVSLYTIDQVLYGHPIYILPEKTVTINISSPSYIVIADKKQFYSYVNYHDTIRILYNKKNDLLFLKSTIDPVKSRVYTDLFQAFGSFKPNHAFKIRRYNSVAEQKSELGIMNEKRTAFFNTHFPGISELNRKYFEDCLFYTGINEIIDTSLVIKNGLTKTKAGADFYRDTAIDLLQYFKKDETPFSLEYMFAAWNLLNLLGNTNDIEKIQTVIDSDFSGKTKEFLLTKALLNNIDFNYNPLQSKSYSKIESLITDSFYRSEILERTNRMNAGFLKANVAEDVLINQNGDSLAFKDILGDREIKIVDFYASWCVPCLREFDGYNELIRKYKGKPVKFIFISMDRSKEDWINFSGRYGFLNDQNNYYLVNDFSSLTAKKYSIKEIPRHIVLNETNHPVNSNAPMIDEKRIDRYLNRR
jgi:thiol-disulfide isomerase/thioredoxin